MDTVKSDESLRVLIINHLGKQLGEHAILKGGMVLRLLDCPRTTNDLDYIFVPFKSKKEIVPLVLEVLKELEEVTVQHRLHSTNAQFDVTLKNEFGTFRTQLEVNVSNHCETEPLTTGDFALQFQQSPQIIRVMRFDVMLAHKLAAWNERRLMRDLYDAYFIYKNLNITPNLDLLQGRLQDVHYAKRMSGRSLPKKMSLEEFWQLLASELKTLTPADLENELRDSLDTHQLLGLDKKITIALTQMMDQVAI
ncbi:MAG: nucleotidyl transferase AbiEii/AbiGii toxin family protein [Deltaproteobacteria bacterium]|nr:nucleotidyl transferase AbiEii/AbiGii toxin family protein [Deltaproteobacteria bacterium]